MYPTQHARNTPDKPAIIMAETGATLSFAELEGLADQGAQLIRSLGIKTGEAVAVMVENDLNYHAIYWAVQRCGLYFIPISTRLQPAEAAYIVEDSGAKALVLTTSLNGAPGLVEALAGKTPIFGVGAPLAGTRDWNDSIATMPAVLIDDPVAGYQMAYSSGTTGRPKGIRLPLRGGPHDAPPIMGLDWGERWALRPDSTYLSPAPLYHSAPLAYTAICNRFGATVILMDHFEPEAFLNAIETYRVTVTQVVPTMFVRLLKLPAEVRARYDLSSLEKVIHAAAPCPVEIKRQIIDWLGLIVVEYYAGSEAAGGTSITAEEWLRKPGSVGRPNFGAGLHIVGPDGEELPAGQIGAVYFSGGTAFEYHNDPGKTRDSQHPTKAGWATMGDIGYVDEDGYLFLTDRKAFMIISGGVNIYPREAEDILISHPKVADVAVIGVPDDDFGEAVKAVVQPMRWDDAGPELAAELIAYCRSRLSALKCPRTVDFDAALPREPNGKLYKLKVRARYWPQPAK